MSPISSRISSMMAIFSPRYRDVCLDEDSDEQDVLLDTTPKTPPNTPPEKPVSRDIYICRMPFDLFAFLTIFALSSAVYGYLCTAFLEDTLGVAIVCGTEGGDKMMLCGDYVKIHALPIALIGVALLLVICVYAVYRIGGRRVSAMSDIAYYVLVFTLVYMLVIFVWLFYRQYTSFAPLPIPLRRQLVADFLGQICAVSLLLFLLNVAAIAVRMMSGQLRHYDDLLSLRRLSTAWREWNDTPITSRRSERICIERDCKSFMKKNKKAKKYTVHKDTPMHNRIDQRMLGKRVGGKLKAVTETPEGLPSGRRAEEGVTPHPSNVFTSPEQD